MKPIGILAAINMRANAQGKPRRFNILAYSGGTLNVDGFDLPVIVDLVGLEVPETPLPILIDHTKSVEATLGMTDSVENTGTALVLAGPVTGASGMAQQVIAQADAGHQWQASIGAMVVDSERIASGQSVQVNGQTFVGPVIVARRAVLRETSVLPMGADATTKVNLAASAAAMKGAMPMSFEDWLKSLGLDPATIDETNKAALQLAYDAQQAPAAPAVPAAAAPAAAVAPSPAAPAVAAGATYDLSASHLQQLQAANRRTIAEDMRRTAQIQAKCAGHPMIAAKAIEEGWSVDKAELEVLRASQGRTTATSFRNGDKAQPQGLVMEAALCIARKTHEAEKQYTPEVLQAANSEYRGRIGLQQVILTAAAANGAYIAPGQQVNREILMAACGKNLNAAASVVSLPGILSNVANKEILTGYMNEDAAWREIAATKSVADFKTVTSYRMLDDMEYEQVGPDGKIKHGRLGEESYTRSADTYAKMFSLTRRDIINDDLGAFDDLRARIGRGSAIKLNKVFWTAFVNNSTFFTTDHTNYITGATSNLGTDGVGLGLGVTAFRKMTSPTADGKKRVGAGMRPEILLVPPELEFAAEALYRNQNLGSVATSSANVFANKYRPVVAWQLSDSAYTGNSTTAWYLLANPSQMPTAVVSFLNGVETPTVESADAEFSTLGIEFRGYHDFGVDMAEYLGGLKSKGAA